ncbi:MAG: 3-deoxy-7-phosphoheptulonate synthase [Lachnospiraceae bacterium]|nr:3-deoxy-7-phosphoheptulonate synthase [Lachnospiraceae bacterium]
MKYVRQLPDAEMLKQELPLSDDQQKLRTMFIDDIKAVLSGKSRKKILCIGPCSADNEDAVLEYMMRLAKLKEEVDSCILIVPRVYTSKPRTNGIGYKGLLHRPVSYKEVDNIYEGLLATRKMHLHIIQKTGFFCADEMLYPEAAYYVNDLLAYTAVGARSVENQQHRLVASGLDTPVGMKNPTSGDIDVMLNAIMAAQYSQNLLYHGWECETEGNPYTHAILRGYVSGGSKIHSNYHYEDLCEIHDQYMLKNLKNPSVIVDCNHGNSKKHYDEQIRISKEVLHLCREFRDINGFVKGIMIESYLEDGCQMIGESTYGRSITDPCLGWKKTERLVKELCEILS